MTFGIRRNPDSFSKRSVALLIFAGVFGFAAAAYFIIYGDGAQSSGANSFSKSAIGHAAFVELLRRRDIPVIVSWSKSGSKAAADSLLVVAEPKLREIKKLGGIPSANRTLLVLPKRLGVPDPNHPGWIGYVGMLSPQSVENVLTAVLPNATLTRAAESVTWHPTALAALQAVRGGGRDNDRLWRTMRSRAAPAIDRPQFIKSESLKPIVASTEGILVGAAETEDGWLFVISDPDLLSNHGIGREDNAALILDLFSLFRPADGAVIFDETVHGFHSNPNLWRQIFELPFLTTTILTVAAIFVLMFAATSRFGTPLPLQKQGRESEAGLIENTVDLLEQAGHGNTIAHRYPAVALRDVAQRLHAPRRLSQPELMNLLDRVGTLRGVKTSYRTLREEIETAAAQRNTSDRRVLRLIQRLYQWKQEMLDGPGRDPSG